MPYGRKSIQFTLQDEHHKERSFNYSIEIWNSNTQNWMSSNDDYSILTVKPPSGTFTDSQNLIVTVQANLPAIVGGGTSPKDAHLKFNFKTESKSGWMLFKASEDLFHHKSSDQSNIDIDYDWNHGRPKIELRFRK